jgi:hypothetical protein
MYYSTYLILFGLLYYIKVIPFNPYIWLLIALFVSIAILIYLLIHNINITQLLLYIILNFPKILLLLTIDKKGLFEGFIFYSILFSIYFIIFKDIYDIYYNKTIVKLLNNDYEI